jgi:AraC-like DNA-binding protein
MSLRYFIPQSLLHPHVRSFAILEEPDFVFNKRIILPDSHPALLINLGAPFIWEMDNGTEVELPRAFFIGVQTKPLKLRATGMCHTIGLNAAPWGTRFLIDEQADLAKSPIVPLNGVWQDLTRTLELTVRQRGDVEAIAVLQQIVEDLYRQTGLDATVIRAAVELLSTTNGRSSLAELAAHCCLSPSQLARHSKYFTGQAPKMLARLIRFDATCAGLLNEPGYRLTDLAHEFGYVDQSHFVHEFKSFAACTPSEARVYVRRLAEDAQFLQFS